ncbi:branched-chain amino acid ABC transporter permease [Streptacidiphilus sp. ASG 303]|uniref:branched-chain amino acid ABC transporter permease n=1 Tax=Streptacidiphilus sp. ASG 303 TaxID=2896847 RepID=UPI001E408197|nr:branched-chain amino acid ABC transporter permease [Streptacidiphilus sp. ASG 303]MCD0481561.1 branched-chain amino acid ABC transporter permease [Streptacidiphilus sp. ASG 303]
MTTTHPGATERTPVVPLPAGAARAATAVGALATAASTLLAWTWTPEFPGNLTISGYPGGLQVLTLTASLLTLLMTAASYHLPGLRWLLPTGSDNAVALLAAGTFATTWYTLVAISAELGGIVNLEPGGYAAGAASLLTLLAALGLPLDRRTRESLRVKVVPPSRDGGSGHAAALPSRLTYPGRLAAFLAARAYLAVSPRLSFTKRPLKAPAHLPAWGEILVVIAAYAAALGIFTYGIDTSYAELFAGFLLTAVFGVIALAQAGVLARLSAITAHQRPIAVAAAFAAAAAFPFTQSDDQYATIGVNILVFATVALGLNVVVGLAGLLDLGYVAFLGVGAYAAALVSGSPSSRFSSIHFPFWAAVLTGAAAAMVFGVLIGAPTLRLRGDYLAIVTLGFGEIFRIAVLNMDGSSGPQLTGGPNGIHDIPDLKILGFDFGQPHQLGGLSLGRFANYYLLMLLFTVFVVTVFSRASNSRIGRAWIAIREDETAALAMGINGFRLKLLAFALGAGLAGLAGTVQAHVTFTVVPEQYQFAGPVPPNSAFLLAAVVLGGMGTISGPLIGASLLYLIPAKFQFLQNYQLLGFGVALVLLMRFRPEGLIPNRRQQLEYHDDTLPGDTGGPTAATPEKDVVGLTQAGA